MSLTNCKIELKLNCALAAVGADNVNANYIIIFVVRYFNFESSLKLQRCRARYLFGSQISWPSGLGNDFVCKRFAVQTLLWSLEFVIRIDLKHNNIAAILFLLSKTRNYMSL